MRIHSLFCTGTCTHISLFMQTKQHKSTGGKYLAQVTQQVFEDLELNKYQFAEYRVSIYGRNSGEWAKLARWVVDHNLFHPNVKWMIQIPRLYAVYKKNKLITSFQDMLDNIFEPLFEITMNPEKDPKLSCFLEQLVGFDSVDDESQREHQFQGRRRKLTRGQ